MKILQLLDNEVCHAKLIEVYSSNISCNLLLAKIFNSRISVETYHGQHVVTWMLCDVNRLEPQNTVSLTFKKSLLSMKFVEESVILEYFEREEVKLATGYKKALMAAALGG